VRYVEVVAAEGGVLGHEDHLDEQPGAGSDEHQREPVPDQVDGVRVGATLGMHEKQSDDHQEQPER